MKFSNDFWRHILIGGGGAAGLALIQFLGHQDFGQWNVLAQLAFQGGAELLNQVIARDKAPPAAGGFVGGVGGRDPNIMRGLGVLLAIGAALLVVASYAGPARAGEIVRHHHRHLVSITIPAAMFALAATTKTVPCTDLFNLMPVGCAPPAGQAKGFLNAVVQQVVDFLTADAPVAAAMATKYPNLQDPNGAACWTKAATLGDLIKDHPLILSGHPIADYEAARLFNIGLNQMCVNSACTQVFTDGGNLVSKIAVGLPVPNFSQACNLIPTIPVPPTAALAAAPASIDPGIMIAPASPATK